MNQSIGEMALTPTGELTRRQFLVGAAVAATGTLLAAHGLPLPPAPLARPWPLERSSFAALLGQQFVLERAAVGPATLRLVAVERLRYPLGDAEQSFALWFRDEHGLALAQDTYSVAHGRTGRFELFLVPMRSASTPGYEAVFNRLPAAQAGGL